MKHHWILIALCLAPLVLYADDLQKSAEDGNPDSQLELGLKLLSDEAMENDVDGMKWLEMSAACGNITANYNLGALYQSGHPSNSKSIKKDANKAILHLTVAAELGEVRAMNRLAGIYYVGDITPKNDILAVKWAVIASGLGDKVAQDNLAAMKTEVSKQSAFLGGKTAASWVERRKTVLFPNSKK